VLRFSIAQTSHGLRLHFVPKALVFCQQLLKLPLIQFASFKTTRLGCVRMSKKR